MGTLNPEAVEESNFGKALWSYTRGSEGGTLSACFFSPLSEIWVPLPICGRLPTPSTHPSTYPLPSGI